MRLKNIIISLFALVLIAGSCESDRCFKKAGPEVHEVIEYDSFSVVQVYGVFNLELVQDTTYFIEVIGPEQAIRGAEFTIKNDSLFCYNYNDCFWRRDYDRLNVRVHFDYLRQVDLMEASYLFSTDSITSPFRLSVRSNVAEADLIFNTKNISFYINSNSGGKYVFRGKTERGFFMNFNAGLFDMSELECNHAMVKNYSILDMKVNANDKLEAWIHNSGHIYYKGNPSEIIDTITSSGKLLPLE